MGNELTKIEPAASRGSVTRYSKMISNLAASIPEWINLSALDGSDLYGYGHPLPEHASTDLIAAAHEHRIALLPAVPEDADKVLRGLRSATILKNEDAVEARATFAILRTHLADVPYDILAEGCRLYCNAPGQRFFPKSAGELRAFINPLVRQRSLRAFRLEKLAHKAREEEEERTRIASDPATPEQIEAIMRQYGIRPTPVGPEATV